MSHMGLILGNLFYLNVTLASRIFNGYLTESGIFH